MSQPQPEETAPAGRAVPTDPPSPETATEAAGGREGQPDEAARHHPAEPDGPADAVDDIDAVDLDDQPTRPTPPPGNSPAAPTPAQHAPSEPSQAEPTRVEPTKAELSQAELSQAELSQAELSQAEPSRTNPAVPTEAETETKAEAEAEAEAETETNTKAETKAAQTSPAAPGGTATEATATRVATPRWTGSAAVPPPRQRRRRWFRGDGEAADAPAPQDVPARQVDPTLQMPAAEADDEEIPTPVDPWAGVADDPWHAHPPVEYDIPAGPPPAPQLPVTRRLPPPATSPPPATPHATTPPPQAPHATTPPPQAPRTTPPLTSRAAPPASPPNRVTPPAPPSRAARPPAPAPPAARKPPPAPAGPPRPPKQRRRPADDLAPAPPGWQAPRGYVPVPVRRRRRWPRVMLTLTLLSIACCCGIPAYYAKPIWDQYPASPADPLPSEILDLRLLDNAAGRQTAEQLKQEVQARNWFTDGEAFAGVYRTSNGKRVVIYGTTGFRFSPESAVQDEILRLEEEYGVTSVESVPTGVRGEYRSCGTGRADGDEVVVCTWADHGSLATALFTRLSITDSSDLLTALRESIIQRDPVGSGNGNPSSG
ncbi:hypothetical protein ACN28C_12760 [Plantactinospora sp. WMMC1484]|uniref:hypothetical protein n=1 Tax=Plantactinospora sp. WMMC1484 TaxID=3404122 RepID=UPI003BF5484B